MSCIKIKIKSKESYKKASDHYVYTMYNIAANISLMHEVN